MRCRDTKGILRAIPAGILGLALLAHPGAKASDPLDEVDGTEGWDQVVQPTAQPKHRQHQQHAFKREVEGWENIRQVWQEERERYLAEKGAHQRLLKRWRESRRPTPDADITENYIRQDGDWGDEPGQELFESSASIDKAIDDELGESGAEPAPPQPRPEPVRAIEPPPVVDDGGIPSGFRENTEVESSEARQRREEEEAAKAAAKMLEEQRERERQAELEQRRKEEDERRRKEEEAAAGAAAAAALLKQQEEALRKEQEVLRKKAKLKVDEEGQVVDPELMEEIEEGPDPEAEEEEDN